MTDIPCKDCITLPICKAKTKENIVSSLCLLLSKCSLIRTYVYSSGVSVPLQEGYRIIELIEFMGWKGKTINELAGFIEWQGETINKRWISNDS